MIVGVGNHWKCGMERLQVRVQSITGITQPIIGKIQDFAFRKNAPDQF